MFREESKHQFLGFVEIIIKSSVDALVKEKKVWNTDVMIKLHDPNKLPYSEFFKDQEYNKHRQEISQLLLRSDHIPPDEIIANGGFHPHCVEKEEYHSHAEAILNPEAHAFNSSKTGSVSCTYSMEMIKNYCNQQNYIYMVIATGGFKGTNPREAEYEITIPGGIDAEDIIAFRQLSGSSFPNKFDTNSSLFVRESFIRRYPHLLDYVLSRYLESNEICQNAKDIISKTPGTAKNNLNNMSLDNIVTKMNELYKSYIEKFPDSCHKERAIAVMNAINSATKIDDIWHILENQYSLFSNKLYSDIERHGTIKIPGLPAKFYSSQHIKLENKLEDEGYASLIEQALCVMPRQETPTSTSGLSEAAIKNKTLVALFQVKYFEKLKNMNPAISYSNKFEKTLLENLESFQEIMEYASRHYESIFIDILKDNPKDFSSDTLQAIANLPPRLEIQNLLMQLDEKKLEADFVSFQIFKNRLKEALNQEKNSSLLSTLFSRSNMLNNIMEENSQITTMRQVILIAYTHKNGNNRSAQILDEIGKEKGINWRKDLAEPFIKEEKRKTELFMLPTQPNKKK